MNKSPEMEKLLDEISRLAFGKTRTEAFETQTCIDCGGPAKDWDSPLSEKEYYISGLCQHCQDSVFK